MAEENEEVKVEKKSSPLIKIVLFGVPAFIVQLILVYFITANLLMDKAGSGVQNGHSEEVATVDSEGGGTGAEGVSAGAGQFVYSIDEIIVNPANTNGRQLLLTSLAFDMTDEASRANLEARDFLVKDMIISVLSSKTTRFLSDISQRDSLRNEISHKIEGFLPDVKLNKVYFSKFILQ